MEVNENILHKPSILQEKVKGAGGHVITSTYFSSDFCHWTARMFSFFSSHPLKVTLQLCCPNLKKVKA